MTLKEAQERHSAKLGEARAAIKDGVTPEARTKYDGIMVELEAIAGDLRRLKQLEDAELEERRRQQADEEARKAGQPTLPQPGIGTSPEDRSDDSAEVEKRKKAYRKAFDKLIRSNDSRELRALGSSVGAQGGYTIPTMTMPEVEQALLSFGGVIPHLGDFSTSAGEQINYPTVNDTTNMGSEIGENIASTEQDMPFGTVASTVGLFHTSYVLIPRTLLQDSAVDLAARVSAMLGERRARLLASKVINGTTSNTSFVSLVGSATVGATSAAPTSITFADMSNIFGAVDPGYAVDGSFVMNRNTQIYLMAQRNAYGTPIFPLDQDGFLTKLFGRPIVIDLNMPNVAAASKSVLFGNTKKYLFRPVGGMEVQRLEERFAEYNQVGFLGFYRAGGFPVDAGTHPIQVLQQHA